MSVLAPEGLPPPRAEATWTPRVRLYLFQPSGEDLPRDLGGAGRSDRPASDRPAERIEGAERPA